MDIEASCLSPASYPIEVGVVGVGTEYQSLIVPEEGWQHWSAESEAVHGICRKALFDKGSPAIEIAHHLNSLLSGATIYSDCKQWDGFWLQVLYGSVGVTPRFVVEDLCTLLVDDLAEEYFSAVERIRRSGKYRDHRALDDARVIFEALKTVRLVE